MAELVAIGLRAKFILIGLKWCGAEDVLSGICEHSSREVVEYVRQSDLTELLDRDSGMWMQRGHGLKQECKKDIYRENGPIRYEYGHRSGLLSRNGSGNNQTFNVQPLCKGSF